MTGYSGPLLLEFVDGRGVEGAGRDAFVRRAITYTDSKGVIWDLHDGTRIDGASIPRPLWSTLGSPFTGPYRRAAAFHDQGYQLQTRAKELVDAMFLEAMLWDGTDITLAHAIYDGVVKFGRNSWTEDQIEHIAELHAVAQAKIAARIAAGGH